MEPESLSLAAHPTDRQLLAHLLSETRLQAGLDIPTVAARWGEKPSRLRQVEAGDCVLDWWEIRRLLAVYGRDLLAFVTEFEDRLAALGAAPDEPAGFLTEPDSLS